MCPCPTIPPIKKIKELNVIPVESDWELCPKLYHGIEYDYRGSFMPSLLHVFFFFFLPTHLPMQRKPVMMERTCDLINWLTINLSNVSRHSLQIYAVDTERKQRNMRFFCRTMWIQ